MSRCALQCDCRDELKVLLQETVRVYVPSRPLYARDNDGKHDWTLLDHAPLTAAMLLQITAGHDAKGQGGGLLAAAGDQQIQGCDFT